MDLNRIEEALSSLTKNQLNQLRQKVEEAENSCSVCNGPFGERYALRTSHKNGSTVGSIMLCPTCLSKVSIGRRTPSAATV